MANKGAQKNKRSVGDSGVAGHLRSGKGGTKRPLAGAHTAKKPPAGRAPKGRWPINKK